MLKQVQMQAPRIQADQLKSACVLLCMSAHYCKDPVPEPKPGAYLQKMLCLHLRSVNDSGLWVLQEPQQLVESPFLIHPIEQRTARLYQACHCVLTVSCSGPVHLSHATASVWQQLVKSPLSDPPHRAACCPTLPGMPLI